MPQLDHFSFFSQVFWVLFFFTTFYFLNLRQTLPAVASILKVRRRVLQKSQDAFNNMQSNKSTNPVESHTEFFAFTKTFASVSLGSPSADLKALQAPFVKTSFDLEFKKLAPQSLALKAFLFFVRKAS
uniref:ATP synthase F0 subunit 8 n=1 Tax=Diacronema viridis TaxID=2793420 RepID=A0A7T1W6B3_9EUKA|nr:ATP synthase F0 subunit 8 [Diacronema viridis]QPO84600.1 ATP synthase F0 subunit 8 [Diacronema viridis]